MSFLKKIRAADMTIDGIQKAIDLLDKDKPYQGIMLKLRHNADKYFNSYYKKSDKEVEEGEKIEQELVKQADQREKELGIKKKNGFRYID